MGKGLHFSRVPGKISLTRRHVGRHRRWRREPAAMRKKKEQPVQRSWGESVPEGTERKLLWLVSEPGRGQN